jgi:integrase
MVSEWVSPLSESGLSASQVRQSYRLLSQMMRSAVDNGLIALSPCRGVKVPRLPDTEPRILTVGEVERMSMAARSPHDLLIRLLAYAGLRVGEAFALRRRCVDVGRGLLRVTEALSEVSGHHSFDAPKTHQRRGVVLPAFLAADLAGHLTESVAADEDALLFVGRTGKPLHYNSWRRSVFDPAVRAAGLDGVTPHDLRASCATWVAANQGVMEAAKRLGHSRASVTTRHYARAVEGRDSEVAAVLHAEREKVLHAGMARAWHGPDTEELPQGTRLPVTSGDAFGGQQR